jgi:hypothetical protein
VGVQELRAEEAVLGEGEVGLDELVELLVAGDALLVAKRAK